VHYRPQFGAISESTRHTSLTFVSQLAEQDGIVQRLGLNGQVAVVKDIRNVSKADMKLNDATPQITVHPENYKVHADGVLLECAPAQVLPMAQRYFLF